ncbi:hypothetical protein SUGI_0589830 [Cryptomeria japonica]|nr:hypothetical protein SUGI_0589830 [Cryptomeria japonica]
MASKSKATALRFALFLGVIAIAADGSDNDNVETQNSNGPQESDNDNVATRTSMLSHYFFTCADVRLQRVGAHRGHLQGGDRLQHKPGAGQRGGHQNKIPLISTLVNSNPGLSDLSAPTKAPQLSLYLAQKDHDNGLQSLSFALCVVYEVITIMAQGSDSAQCIYSVYVKTGTVDSAGTDSTISLVVGNAEGAKYSTNGLVSWGRPTTTSRTEIWTCSAGWEFA